MLQLNSEKKGMTLAISDDINVLIVDDIPQNLIAMEALLARPGLHILKATSGRQALEQLLTHEVALALLDVNMPEMDGFELAELIRGNPKTRGIPLIFITAALRETSGIFRSYRAGAVDFMHKPFDPEILRSKVDVFVELYTQRKQMALQLTELKKALQVNEMFTAVLGHDLRNPLTTVLNGAELITLMTDHAKVQKTAQLIQSSGRRMNMMINQLLDAAIARSGEIKLKLAQHDYVEISQRIINEFLDLHESREIRLQCDGESMAVFDADRVAQIFSNLIGNALQHGVTGQPITVHIDGSDKAHIGISVHNGGHIEAEQLVEIFKPYQSAQVEDRRTSGLGLGLYIVKHFVKAHGGEVAVRSTPTEGTFFDVRLPRTPCVD